MSNKDSFQPELVSQGKITAKISSGQGASEVFYCAGVSPIGILTDSNFTDCNISFKTSLTGQGNFKVLGDPSGNGNAITGTMTSDFHWPLDPAVFAGAQYIQVITDIAMAQDTNFTFILGPVWE